MKKPIVLVLALLPVRAAFAGDPSSYKEQNLKGKVRTVILCTGDDSTRLVCYNKISYDRQGNELSHIILYSDGTHGDSTYYLYQDGRLIEHDNISWRTKFRYDATGKLVEASRYTRADSSLAERVLYSYSADGSENGEKSYNKDGQLNHDMKVTYSADGQIETYYLPSGQVQLKKEYYYDKNGDLSTHKEFMAADGEGMQRTLKYTYLRYDRQGNWVMRSQVHSTPDFQVRTFTARHIEYYE